MLQVFQADPTTPIGDRLHRGAAQDVDEATSHATGELDQSATVTFEHLNTGVKATINLSPEAMVVLGGWLDAPYIREGQYM